MTDSENRVLIITGGRMEDAFLGGLAGRERYSMVIAVDSGLAAADRLNLAIDYIVGDFDSAPVSILMKYKEKSTPIAAFPTEKDKTDTQIAIELALMHNAAAIDIVGATGSRLDHTLANIHLLLLPLQVGIPACILDPNNKIYLKDESFIIQKNEQYGNYVSLLPFTDKVDGLTLTGFKYPLNHITLTAGSSLGISNEIKEDKARIELTQGILLVMETKD
jgi:thiamine pyrophosphokinase